MGVVWAGTDREHQRKYAIKLLRFVGDSAARAKLLERARSAIPLRHPNALPLYEVGSEGTRDFIAMELVEGESLADWLAAAPPQREVIEAMLSAGQALQAAHQAGIVHRNFKLHNVLRGKDGRVRVADFGQARGHLEAKGDRTLTPMAVAAGNSLEAGRPPPRNQHAVLDASLTQRGVYVGAPGYMAPELWRGSPADARSDQFAFCVATWEALVGERPFGGETLEDLERAMRSGVAAGRGTSLPAALRTALVRGLDADPARRWPDLSGLLVALERNGDPRSRSRVTAAAVLVALAALVAIYLLVRGGPSEPIALPVESVAPIDETCETPRSFEEVWTAERRARLVAQLAAPGAASLGQIEEVGRRWSSAYAAACAISDEVAAQRQLACLLLAREHADAAIQQLEGGAAPELAASELAALEPEIEACRR